MSLSPQQLFAVLTPAPQFVATLAEAGPAGPQGPPGAHGTPTTIADEGVSLAPFDILNFLGAGVTAAVDAPNNRINVTIPGGGSQTPWTSDINGATFSLSNVGNITLSGSISAGSNCIVAGGVEGGSIHSLGTLGIGPYARYALISVPMDGAVNSGALAFQTNDLGTLAERMRVSADGRVGLPTPHATYKLNVTGDINATGVYRINGVALAAGHTIEDEGTARTQRTKLNFVGAGVTVTDDSGNDRTIVTIPTGTQTPWTSNINGGAFALSNTSSIEIRAVSYPLLALYDSTGSANQKWWRFILMTGNDFRLECLQDGGTATTAMEIIRTGAAPTDAYIYCPLTVTKLTVTAAQGITVSLLPSTNPGAGTKQLYYLPGDSNRVYYAA